jgi:8-oxo-dGTP diphosphatase
MSSGRPSGVAHGEKPERPLVKAVAAILDNAAQILVQCDLEESFYRLPGGTVELGETAASAVTRELREEYGIPALVGPLRVVVENRFVAAGRLCHELVLVHQVSIEPFFSASARQFAHAEDESIQLVWRKLDRLGPMLVPSGLDRILQARADCPVHLIVGDDP